jgi:hypothetical protein
MFLEIKDHPRSGCEGFLYIPDGCEGFLYIPEGCEGFLILIAPQSAGYLKVFVKKAFVLMLCFHDIELT